MYKKIMLIVSCLILSIAFAERIQISKSGDFASVPLEKPATYVADNSNRTTLLEESFTGTTFPPTGWTRIQLNTGTQGGYSCYWDRFTAPAGIFHSAPASAGLWWSYNDQNEILITPPITLTGSAGGVYYLKWWYYGFCGSTYGDHYYTKLITSAGDTIVLYDLSTQTGGWQYYVAPVEISLNAYAGQTVKIAWYADDPPPPNGPGLWYAWAIDDVEIGYPAANDVGIEAILSPGGYHIPNTPMTPSASVKNYGSATQTNFPVVCSIVGPGNVFRYTSTQTVSSLAAGATTTVNFTQWTPTISEAVTVIMRTNLAGDENPANDRKTQTTNIANVYSQDFEANNGSFVPDPLTSAWEWGTPSSGPSGAHSGTKLWGTVLAGQYVSSADWKLTSPIYTATTNNPTLHFWHWYEMESGYDGGNVKISTDGGGTWTVITPVSGYNGTGYSGTGIAGEPCWTGTTTGNSWNEAVFPLTLTSGQQFYLRWHFASDASVTYSGWYIDDLLGDGFGPQPPAQKDVGVDAIIAPLAMHTVNTSMTPIAKIKNYGAASQSGFAVVCSMVGTGGAVRYSNTKTAGTIAAGDTARITFDPWIPTILEDLTVIMRTNLANDTNPANDRKVRTTTVHSYLLVEGFNDVTFPPVGWDTLRISGTSASNTWSRQTSGTYPTCTPIEGVAMARYNSFSASAGNASRLFSPPINLGSTAQPCSLKFYMTHDPGYASSDDNIKVQYSTNGVDYIDVATFSRYASAFAWTEHAVYLGSFSGTIRIAFLATSAYGNNMFIDDVRLKGGSLGVEEEKPNKLPTVTTLNVPKPNPVKNGVAHISFNIAEPTKASLKIYDASGKLVKTLVNEFMNAGVYNLTWNGTDDNSNRVSDGIYFYTLETSSKNFTKKLVLTR